MAVQQRLKRRCMTRILGLLGSRSYRGPDGSGCRRSALQALVRRDRSPSRWFPWGLVPPTFHSTDAAFAARCPLPAAFQQVALHSVLRTWSCGGVHGTVHSHMLRRNALDGARRLVRSTHGSKVPDKARSIAPVSASELESFSRPSSTMAVRRSHAPRSFGRRGASSPTLSCGRP